MGDNPLLFQIKVFWDLQDFVLISVEIRTRSNRCQRTPSSESPANFSFYDLLAFIISDNKGTQHFQKR